MDLTREKLINAILYFAANTKLCGKTKLVKLLYYLDFMHFRETARSVTGLTYGAWQFGPYPTEFARELDNPPADLRAAITIQKAANGSFLGVKPRKRFNSEVFSPREKRLLEKIAFIFKDARADDMVEASHLPNHPWDRTIKAKGEKAEIDYMLAIDSQAGSISLEEAEERIRDREALRDLAAS